jgi:hypothetical protein
MRQVDQAFLPQLQGLQLAVLVAAAVEIHLDLVELQRLAVELVAVELQTELLVLQTLAAVVGVVLLQVQAQQTVELAVQEL